MQLEVGKYCKTRDGGKVGPMRRTALSTFSFRHDIDNWYTEFGYHETGYTYRNIPGMDIVSEWVDDVRHDKDLAPYEIAAQYKIIVTVTIGDITITYDGRDQ